ncbi:hypothetical protein F5J12DRAFT_895431 [Pisolithus orientalis]|uniref:uncharacterized protein n=1 Tax=Pisolithus orientalis TaxID=936130 RepID=UPI0022259661|nr:uncharacterized protein F5J12DRAFT_895431 [Pisolithus orientalis]KAI5998501.1 hypothetical protein F5J12DRAFT_895431 [Pisolithus orientalis]
MAFIEDANGQELVSKKITNVLQTMQSIWHEFCTHRLIDAQTTWTLMSLQVKKAFCGELVQAFPELNFCEDLWKSDLLAKKHYLSFKQTWFMNRTDEKTNSATKHKTKSKVVKDADSLTGVGNIKHTKIGVFMAPDNSNDDGLQADSADMSSSSVDLASSNSIGLSISNMNNAPGVLILFSESLSASSPLLLQNDQDCDAHMRPDCACTPGMPVIPVVPTLNTVEQEDNTGISMAAQLIKNPLSSLHPPPVVRDLPEPTMTISKSVQLNENSNLSNECMSTINKGESQVKAPSTSKRCQLTNICPDMESRCNVEHIITISAANGPTTHRWNEFPHGLPTDKALHNWYAANFGKIVPPEFPLGGNSKGKDAKQEADKYWGYCSPNGGREFNVGRPGEFDGSHKGLQTWLTQVEGYLNLNSHVYNTDVLKISFVLMYMTKGAAVSFAENY